MRTLVSTSLAVLLVILGLNATAFAEIVYVNRRDPQAPYKTTLESLDCSDGSVMTTYESALSYGGPEGLALSANESILYMAVDLAPGMGPGYLRSYNTDTGALINSWTIVATGKAMRGIAVDRATGNIYCTYYTTSYGSSYKRGMIAQVTPEGVVDDDWGSYVTTTNSQMCDLEIFDGNLYGAGNGAYAYGVYSWDLSTGGNPTVLGNTGGNRTDGLCFAPDGTLYTSNDSGKVLKWTSTSSPYDTSTQIVDLGESVITDIDYVDGYLYATRYTTDNDPTGYLTKIDLSDNSTSTVACWTSGRYRAMFLVHETPEPSTLVLFFSGLLVLLAYAWRKRK